MSKIINISVESHLNYHIIAHLVQILNTDLQKKKKSHRGNIFCYDDKNQNDFIIIFSVESNRERAAFAFENDRSRLASLIDQELDLG